MATKKIKDPAIERQKLIAKVVKATVGKNMVLPILENVMLSEDFLTVTDLETDVSIPYPTGVEQCIPANRFLDCLSMMENPAIREVQNPVPVPKHFRVDGKIYHEYDGDAKIQYQSYIKRTDEEDQMKFPEWCAANLSELKEEDVVQKFTQSVEISSGKRKVKLEPDNPDNFPVTGIRNDGEDFNLLMEFGEREMGFLETALKFVSTDDLRPAMTGIYFSKDIVATDAHRLYWQEIEPVAHPFILPAKTAKLLLLIGGTWDCYGNGTYETKDGKIVVKHPTKREKVVHVCFCLPEHDPEDPYTRFYKGTLEEAQSEYEKREDWMSDWVFESWVNRTLEKVDKDGEYEDVPDFERDPVPVQLSQNHVMFVNSDGIMIKTRVIDARFPDYGCVIPQGEGNYLLTANPDELLKEIRNAGKFANRSTNQVTFYLNGSCSVSSCDIDFNFSYESEVEQAEIHKKNEDENLRIAFNGKFLDQIVADLGCQPITMKMWAHDKATIINDHYLVMPLMTNQD